MEYGMVRVGAGTIRVVVGDCFGNVGRMASLMRRAAGEGVEMLVFPELSVTGYTCRDLFADGRLLAGAEEGLLKLVGATRELGVFGVAGVPLVAKSGGLVNAAVAFQGGEILGVVAKSYLPNYKEFEEGRWFTSAFDLREGSIAVGGKEYPLSGRMLFASGEVRVGIELCEDLWTPVPPSSLLAMEGANIVLNLSASNELVGKHAYRRSLVAQQSARCMAGYVYAMAGCGESSGDVVYGGGGIIAENGVILAESERFVLGETLTVSEIDVSALQHDRRVNLSFQRGAGRLLGEGGPVVVPFRLSEGMRLPLVRRIDAHPFVPSGEALDERCEEIINIQVAGLSQRLAHVGAQSAVVGVSGGLDSTLALVVTAEAFDALQIPRRQITGVTMPGFGTTERTRKNAISLIRSLGVTLQEIPITEACLQHFKDIGHDPSVHDITYENSQARERTQILMDIANAVNGLVVGTGDLSELALGWTTYNGDHISMYGVNVGVPKTLVRHLVEWAAEHRVGDASRAILQDIAATPISPELTPADAGGNIAQKTEELIGPYELHDFFLYYFLRFGTPPAKIFYLAQQAFGSKYDKEVIRKWLRTFLRRFFAQQYKRNCLPDGPKVGSVGLSPRSEWRMPSDASPDLWLTF